MFTISSKRPFRILSRPLITACALGAVLVLFAQRPADPAAKTARLSVTVLDDATGEPVAARVRVTDATGAPIPSPEAGVKVMYLPPAEKPRFAAQPDGAFYIEKDFTAQLPAGRYELTVSKGSEYLAQTHALELRAGQPCERTVRLQRWTNSAARGWYSADGHIHIHRSPSENAPLMTWLAAEDLHVGVLLQWGDFFCVHDHQYAFGKEGVYQVGNRLLASGQEEPRTHEIGHTIAFGADDFVRVGTYYRYDRFFDRLHQLHGVTGYAHQAMSFHGYRGMTMDVPTGKVDFLEILQFCVLGGPLLTEHYYEFLDLGYKLTATAGSDFPYCGRGPRFGFPHPQLPQIGNARFYTHVDGAFDHERWREAVRAGHTYVSTGPVLEFTVDDKLPGDEVYLPAAGKVRVQARAWGHAEHMALEALEIVSGGEVVRAIAPGGPGQTSAALTLEFELPIEHGAWIAARCRAGLAQVAHTTPVYVRVAGGSFHNPKTAAQCLERCEQYLQELEQEIAKPDQPIHQNGWRSRPELETRIAETRKLVAELRARF